MSEIPTEHLQLQKIREKATEILAKLDDVKVDLLRIGRVYVENLRTLRNADFEEWIDDNTLLGWMQSDYEGLISKHDPFLSGFWCVEFAAASCKISQLLEVPIEGHLIKKLSIVAKGQSTNSAIDFGVYYTDGSFTSHTFDLRGPLYIDYCDMTPYIDKTKTVTGIQIANHGVAPPPPPTFYGVWLDQAVLLISELPRLPAAPLAGQQTVATAGSPVVLGSGAISHSVLIQPIPTNTGNILVGNLSNQYFVLTPTSEPIRIFADDLADIYIDAAVNGEGVNYIGG